MSRPVNALLLVLAACTLLLLAIPAAAPAATVTWDGGGGADNAWHTANNWDGNALPQPGDDVVIPVVGSTTVLIDALSGSALGHLASLTIDDGATVRQSTLVTVKGATVISVAGTWDTNGNSIYNGTGPDAFIGSFDVTTTGSFGNDAGASTTSHVFPAMSVDGTLFASAGNLTLNNPVTLADGAIMSVPASTAKLQFANAAHVVLGAITATGSGTIAATATQESRGIDLAGNMFTLGTNTQLELKGAGGALDGGGNIVGGRLLVQNRPFGTSGAFDLSATTSVVQVANTKLAGTSDVYLRGTWNMETWSLTADAHTGALQVFDGGVLTRHASVGISTLAVGTDLYGAIVVPPDATIQVMPVDPDTMNVYDGGSASLGSASSTLALRGGINLGSDMTIAGPGRVTHDVNSSTIGFNLGGHQLSLDAGDTPTRLVLTGNGSLDAGGSISGGLVQLAGTPFGEDGAFELSATTRVVLTAPTTLSGEADITVHGDWDLGSFTLYGSGSYTPHAGSFVVSPTGTVRRSAPVSGGMYPASTTIEGSIVAATGAGITLGPITNLDIGNTLVGGTWHVADSAFVRIPHIGPIDVLADATVVLEGAAQLRNNAGSDALGGHGIGLSSATLGLAAGAELDLGAGTLDITQGTLVVGDDSSVSASLVDTEDAIIGGTGTIHGDVAATDSHVQPGLTRAGDEAGALTIDGDVTMTDSILLVQVTGGGASQTDKLTVSGTITADATSGVRSDWAGHPAPAYTFTQPFLTASAIVDEDGVLAQTDADNLAAPRIATVAAAGNVRSLGVTETGAPGNPSTVTSTTHVVGATSSSTSIGIALSVDAADGAGGSGIAGYQAVVSASSVDPIVAAQVGHAGVGFTVAVPGNGTWYVFVRSIDNIGNAATSWRRIGPFVIDTAHVVPVTPTPIPPKPPVDEQPPVDPVPPVVAKPPVKPAASKVVFVGRQPKLAALGKAGTLKLRVPVRDRRVKVVLQLQVNAAKAKVLGLKLPKRRKALVIGTGSATSTKPGMVTVTVRLTSAGKRAFAKAGGRSSKVRQAKASLRVTLSKGGASSSLTKPLTFRR